MLIPKQLLAITKLVPKDASRYTLNAVLAERMGPDTVRLVETDGHQMVVVDYADHSADFPTADFDASAKDGFRVMLPGEFVEEAGRTIPKSPNLPVLENLAVNEFPNGKVQLATTDLETTRKFETKTPEGQFPNYQVCLPKSGRPVAVRIGVNAKLLAKTLQTVASMMGDRNLQVTLILQDAESPIEIQAENIDLDAKIRAVVMPCRL